MTIDARFKCDNPLLVLVAVLAISACAATPPAEQVSSHAAGVSCEQVAADYEQFIDRQGVNTAYGMPLDGAPWFRMMRGWDRWPMAQGPAPRQQWIAAAASLGAQAWQATLMNASDQATADRLREQMQRCSWQAQAEPVDERRWARWADASQNNSAYSGWQRWLGFYPVTGIGLKQGVHAWQREYLGEFGPAAEQADWPVYGGQAASPRLIQQLLDETPVLPGLERPSYESLQRWVDQHAPVFRIESAGPADQPGQPIWIGDRLAFDTQTPVVHVQLLPWQDRGEPVWQLVYTLWFAGRPAVSPWDPYAGALDGIVWRVTLDSSGAVRMRDSIHPCGCYHVLFPPGPQVADATIGEPALVPKRLQTDGRAEVVVRGTDHMIMDVALAESVAAAVQRYALVPYTDLLSMPVAGSVQRRSLFDAKGFVPASRRSERWYLWPSGVRSPGTMRIWGRHAIAFVGMRHFDDPNLFADLLVDQQPAAETAAP